MFSICCISYMWQIGQPLQDFKDSFEVIRHHSMRHTIVVHNLYTSKLAVAGVHFSTQHLNDRKQYS